MASRFLVPDREQTFLEAVSYREVLGDDHPVWTVIDVVEGLDLSAIYGRYVSDVSVGGRRAFDPAMLLALLVFGYSEGKRSSRQLEDACRRDWAYRAICGEITPDHATIARFRQGLDDVLESLFAQVLAVCSAAGLVEVGLVALDGTRMAGAASKEANKTASTLQRLEAEARVMLDEAAAADDADSDGDGVDGVRVSSKTRRDTERMRRVVRIREAQRVVADAVATQTGEKRRGRQKRPVVNVTDPESRLQKTRNGFIQGYNAQTVVSADQVVVACEVTPDPTDVGWLEPMLTTAVVNVEAAGVDDRVGVAVADAGYWSQANAEAEDALGVELLIATTKSHRVGGPAGEDEEAASRDRERLPVISRIDDGDATIANGARQLGLSHSWVSVLLGRYRRHGSLVSEATLARHEMERRLTQPANRDRYRQRGWLVEGSFAHVKTHRNTSRFSRRGLTACNAEWKLINLAGNLLKLHRRPDTGPGSGPEPASGSGSGVQESRNTTNPTACTRPDTTTRLTHRTRHCGQ